MSEYFTRYGFTENPFALRILDPLQREADAQHILIVDGFSELEKVNNYLGPRVSSVDPKPAFVLVAGAEKSGRSSAANEILLRSKKVNSGSNEKFVPLGLEAEDHGVLQLYRRWTSAIYSEADSLGLGLGDEVQKAFDAIEELKAQETLEFRLQLIMKRLIPFLKGGPARMASCVEGVKNEKVIAAAEVVFKDFPIVCVFTVQPGSFDLAKYKKHPNVHLLELGHLKADEVSKVVKKRWGDVSPVPFDVPTLGSFCETKKHSVGAVLTVAERLLARRVRVYETLKADGVWPTDNRLGFSDVETLQSLEGALEAVIYGDK